ncbi:hypothetical protein [Caballeronia grimmiae]|uniref:hypothetical protein n=1 Tax=Caballeronia grimmiae TaxID=1071679 RepID=UPI0038BACC42
MTKSECGQSDAENVESVEALREGKETGPRPVEASGMGPLERTNLASILGGIGQRLSDLEDRLKLPHSNEPNSSTWLEFAKIVFGGWPIFGFVVLIAFYQPLSNALNSISGNLKRTNEIAAFGITFKMAVEDEAEKSGQVQLSKTLPSLTTPALAFLLRGSDSINSLIDMNRANKKVVAFWLPNDTILQILEELESKGLVRVQVNGADSTVKRMRASIDDFKNTYPAQDHTLSPRFEYWGFARPADIQLPNYSWQLSELGRTAVKIIINAVSAQLLEASEAKKRAATE